MMNRQNNTCGEAGEEKRTELITTLLEEYKSTSVDELYDNVKSTIARRSRRRKSIGISRRIAAVLILALITGAAFYWFAGEMDSAGTGMRIDENVLLVMDNGARFVLDKSGSNARIAEMDDVAIINNENGLVYEPQMPAEKQEADSDVVYSTLNIPRGMTFSLTLEDGTQVWLDADSRMRFPSVFRESERRIFLEGEAYFKVAHDSDRPFIVETADQVLTVTGTEFNIYAYPGETGTYTTLVKGSVELSSADGRSHTTLKPGQLATLHEGSYRVEEADIDGTILWKDGMFAFNNNSLDMIFKRMSRWYDIQYTFEDPEAANLVLMGNLPVYDEIGPILDIIEGPGQVVFKRKGKNIRIYTRK